MKVEGEAVRLGDNIDTDLILAGKYLTLTDPNELAKHALESLDPSFSEKAKKGVIIVAGRNFGCGSSREHAPIALKHAGVRCVIARSFARIFYRNAINIGLPVVESEEAPDQIKEGDRVIVDLIDGIITDATLSRSFKAQAMPGFLLEIIKDGGLVPHIKKTRLPKNVGGPSLA